MGGKNLMEKLWRTVVVDEGGPEVRVYEEKRRKGDLSRVVSSAV